MIFLLKLLNQINAFTAVTIVSQGEKLTASVVDSSETTGSSPIEVTMVVSVPLGGGIIIPPSA